MPSKTSELQASDFGDGDTRSAPGKPDLAAAIRAWNHLRSGLNTAQFAERLQDEGWQPEGVPAEALLVLMQEQPYCAHFQQQNGHWYLLSTMKNKVNEK